MKIVVLGLLALLAAPAVQARPGSFNVKDFGAKGDGVADDTSAVQSAIHAATKSAGGGTVIFPKGTYLLNCRSPSPSRTTRFRWGREPAS